ncbi:putative COP9 complex subunit 2 [Paramyrothecium foliicola]|nr:putative COP9 complex subunit 2 [Paramyrothecium foliicola]
MSDDEDFMQESDEEQYDFEYEEDDDDNADDVDIENKYYNAKQLKLSDPKDAIIEFLGIPALEEEKGEWGFKGLKQAIKLEFKLGQYDKAAEHFEELLTYVKSAVTRNYSEKSINNMLDYIEKGADGDAAVESMEKFYSLTLQSFQSTNNERLWLKTNIKLAKLLLDRKEYGAVGKKLKELHKACQREDGTDDSSKGTYLLEIYALEIQMFAEKKNNKQLKALYQKALKVKSAVPHPRIMGIIRECGGKMHMSEENWKEAQSDFFESFRNYDEAGSLQRIQVLKYLLLTTMLMKSNINPFDSQETKPYKTDPRISAMTELVDAYQRDEVHSYEQVLQKNQDILADPFIAENIDEVTRNMRTKGVLKLIAPYTRMKLSWIAKQLKISEPEVQDILGFLIVDGKIKGTINQQDGILEITSAADIERIETLKTLTGSINELFMSIFKEGDGHLADAAAGDDLSMDSQGLGAGALSNVPHKPHYTTPYANIPAKQFALLAFPTGLASSARPTTNNKKERASSAPIVDLGFLFAPSGGGAASGLGCGSASSSALGLASSLALSGRAPARTRHKPDPRPEAAVGLGVAATTLASQRYASQPVSVCSSSSSPSSSTSSPSTASVAAAAAGTTATYPRRTQASPQFSPSQKSPFGVDMASQQQPQHQQHDVAAQQEAARDYQPNLEGPLVGNKTPSHAITDEYAKADQVYVEKTIALPQTYSHYRPIQGDGNCGWRAIGFSYYEKLIENGDQAQIEGEVARLRSLNQMLATVGGYNYFEDWAEEAFQLLRDLASHVGNPAVAHMLLHQRWNDPDVAGGIIYYLRLLAATYLKANADTYSPFVSDENGIQGYCSHSVEILNREIEHLGIVALANILLKPVNFVLEIAYLDRSPGSEVNRYRFPEEANNQDVSNLGPIIYLLYRPDHYDILYQSTGSPINVPVQPVSMQVNRVSGFSHNIDIAGTQPSLGTFSSVDFSPLALIPGLIPTGADMSPPLASPTAPSPIGEPFASQQQGPWLMPYSDELSTQQPTPQQQPPVLAAAPSSSATSTAPLSPTTPMGSGPSRINTTNIGTQGGMMQNMGNQGQTSVPAPGYQIRFSPVQLEYEESKSSLPEQTFQVTTNTFKNSVWNRAHYGNPDFHPEEWIPDDDGIDGRIAGRRRSRKDS